MLCIRITVDTFLVSHWYVNSCSQSLIRQDVRLPSVVIDCSDQSHLAWTSLRHEYFCLGTGVPRHRDSVVRPYRCMYVFSVLCSIFQYVIKWWLCALQLVEAENTKVITLLMNILTRTMNTLSGLWILSMNSAIWLSCSKLHTDCSQLS